MVWIEYTLIEWGNERKGVGPKGSERTQGETLRIAFVDPRGCARGKETTRREGKGVGGVESPWAHRKIEINREWVNEWNT